MTDKLLELQKVLSDHKTLLILTHDYPDPDALSSALLLSFLVRKRFNMRSRIAFGGLINRAENRAMVQQLRIKMTHVDKIRWARYKCIALVDTQPDFGNHSLPKGITPKIVFDHHPKASQAASTFEDICTEYGATATLLLEYLRVAELEITVDLATAVTYAIRSETLEFQRETSAKDMEVYRDVYSKANKRKLANIFNPKLPRSYFELLRGALENAKIYRNLAHVHLGEVQSPEFVSQIADLLVRHERITWAICTGRLDDHLYVSMRSSHAHARAGQMLRKIIGNLGSAGGHAMTAGGQIPLAGGKNGNFTELQDKIISRFLRKLKLGADSEWKAMLPSDEAQVVSNVLADLQTSE